MAFQELAKLVLEAFLRPQDIPNDWMDGFCLIASTQ